jgi:hypothetical protein
MEIDQEFLEIQDHIDVVKEAPKPASLEDVVARLDRLIELQEGFAYNLDTYMMWWRNR